MLKVHYTIQLAFTQDNLEQIYFRVADSSVQQSTTERALIC